MICATHSHNQSIFLFNWDLRPFSAETADAAPMAAAPSPRDNRPSYASRYGEISQFESVEETVDESDFALPEDLSEEHNGHEADAPFVLSWPSAHL